MKISGATVGAVMAMMMACLYAPMVSAAMTSMAGDEIQLEGGQRYLNNNQWGAVDGDDGWQQIFYNSPFDMGWRWHWPSMTNRIKAYPAMVTGWHWSSPHAANSNLPVPISSLHHLQTRVRYDVVANGRYDIAYDLWCHSTPHARWYSFPAAEVMVWLHSVDMQPVGDYKGSLMLDGHRWRFYVGFLPAGWPVYTFVLEGSATELSLDIQPLLGYITDTVHWDSKELFLSGIEFGSEIYSGSGEFHLRDWFLDVNRD